MVGASLHNFIPEQKELRERYNMGFEDAVLQLESMVKKLGNKYHKEFLVNLKNIDNGRYSTASFTITNHKCNCDFCGLI